MLAVVITVVMVVMRDPSPEHTSSLWSTALASHAPLSHEGKSSQHLPQLEIMFIYIFLFHIILSSHTMSTVHLHLLSSILWPGSEQVLMYFLSERTVCIASNS